MPSPLWRGGLFVCRALVRAMTISEIINKAVEKAGRTPENILSVEVLLAYCLNLEKEDLFMEPGREISATEVNRFVPLFERFIMGEPVAYLTGIKEFYGLDFYVDANVLIPRPETELLVDKVLSVVPDKGAEVKILDVGTGSGCIAISLAKRLPSAMITATDISGPAIEIARRNAFSHGVESRINFVVTDLMENIEGPFDFVVANLPYIGKEKFNFVSREAEKYEPHVALFGGDDGLRLYEKLFRQLNSQKWRPRFFMGEFGFLQGDEMRRILGEHFGGLGRDILKDYASIERIFVVGFDPPHTSRRRVCFKKEVRVSGHDSHERKTTEN